MNKKLVKVLAVGLVALMVVAGNAGLVEAATQNEMVAMVSEEMTANYLYTELAKKYPDVQLFTNLAKSEARHTEALKRAAGRLGLSVDTAKPADIKIPATLEEALAFALAFELEDINMLKNLIEKEEDAGVKRVLNNLLKGSTNHYNTLKKAIDSGVENVTCTGERSYPNRADNQAQRGGQGQGQGQGKGQGQGQGQGQGLGRGQNANLQNGQAGQRGGNRAVNQANCPYNGQ